MKNLTKILDSKNTGFGPEVKELEQLFTKISRKKYAVATSSASMSAYMIFRFLFEKHPNRTCFIPTLSFTSPAWAARQFSDRVFFCDIDDNLQCKVDPHLKDSFYMGLLYGGRSTNHVYTEVLDCAHSVVVDPNTYKYGFYSFFHSKPIWCISGGMVTTDDEEAANWFRSFRNFGRSAEGIDYSIINGGSKFYMDRFNAQMALDNLPLIEEQRRIRKRYHNIYRNELYDELFMEHDEESSYYLCTLLNENGSAIRQLMSLPLHYPLLHRQPFYYGKTVFPQLNNSEELVDKIVNLPIHHFLPEKEVVKKAKRAKYLVSNL